MRIRTEVLALLPALVCSCSAEESRSARWPTADAVARFLITTRSGSIEDVRGPFLKEDLARLAAQPETELHVLELSEPTIRALTANTDDAADFMLHLQPEVCEEGRVTPNGTLIRALPPTTSLYRYRPEGNRFDLDADNPLLMELALEFPEQAPSCALGDGRALQPFAATATVSEYRYVRHIFALNEDELFIVAAAAFVVRRDERVSLSGAVWPGSLEPESVFAGAALRPDHPGPGHVATMTLSSPGDAAWLIEVQILNGQVTPLRTERFDFELHGVMYVRDSAIALASERIVELPPMGPPRVVELPDAFRLREGRKIDELPETYFFGTREGHLVEGDPLVGPLRNYQVSQLLTFHNSRITDLVYVDQADSPFVLLTSVDRGAFARLGAGRFELYPFVGGDELAPCRAVRTDCGHFEASPELDDVLRLPSGNLLIEVNDCTWPLLHDPKTGCTTVLPRPDVPMALDAQRAIRSFATDGTRVYVGTDRSLFELRGP